jgi:hypothetical protein
MGAKEVTYRVVVGGEHEWFNGYFEGLTWPFNISVKRPFSLIFCN